MSTMRCGSVQLSKRAFSGRPSSEVRSSIARMRDPSPTRSIGWTTRPSSFCRERAISPRSCSSGEKTRRCAFNFKPGSTPFSLSSFSCATPASPSSGIRPNGCSSQYILTRNCSLPSSFVVAHAPLKASLLHETLP
eukprot:4109020-Prymnesium_polylepis.1